ncbi:uncharacterized protein N7503_006849 [Penicillium pulvis]|uniref:uncharacterized protein n=1 Tax=Penicillium pulvis TaxID=1562058 RepID=UPI0025468DE0|nr:uncharacterized protein N7503_006849 [Penicillium pulvis]KAJ5797553.1 hypothetical protein N7503_006849 [Penicillium pulvis]
MNQPAPNVLIEMKEAGHKGLGMFAKVDIPRGTRVIAETPLLNTQLNDDGDPESKQILQGFELLTPPQRDSFLGLSGYASTIFKMSVTDEFKQAWEDIPELHRTVLSIFKANAFGGMIFLTGSRINHSCIPNLNYAYNNVLEKGTFHAVRDISAGEELTVMYIDGANRPRTRRQSELLQWGFLCVCPACEHTPEGDLKEKRRLELFLIDQVLTINELSGAQESARGALQLAQKMAGIQKSEGLVNRALTASYRDATMYSLRLGNPQMALLWAEKGLEVELYCVGEDHPDYQQMLDTVGVLQGFNAIPEPLLTVLAGLIMYM